MRNRADQKDNENFFNKTVRTYNFLKLVYLKMRNRTDRKMMKYKKVITHRLSL